MVKITKEAALEYHEAGRPGKIEVKQTKPYHTQTDLSLAYSPGVAFPCLEIQQNPKSKKLQNHCLADETPSFSVCIHSAYPLVLETGEFRN